MNRSPRLPNLARRTIPVAIPAPTQLVLGLRWEQPIDRVHAARDPEPATPVIKVRRAA